MEINDICFLTEHFGSATKIPCRVLMHGGYTIVPGEASERDREPFFSDEKLATGMWTLAQEAYGVQIVSEGDWLHYALFHVKNEMCVVLGPVCYGMPEDAECARYRVRHALRASDWRPAVLDREAFVSAVLLAYFCFTGERLTPEEIGMPKTGGYDLDQNRLELYIHEQKLEENERNQITYQREQASLQTIRDGDPETARARSMELGALELLPRKTADVRKHYEYLACSTIAVAAHVAMDSGVRAELAYSLIDVGQQRLSVCRTIQEMVRLMQDTMVGFAYCVQSSRGRKAIGYYTEGCEEYIRRHLYTPFTVREMARDLGFHPNYLSAKFVRENGISITRYVRKLRMEIAANLLRYSDMEIGAVAQHLCYATQSHFGEHFRAEYGVSPQRFRMREKRK